MKEGKNTERFKTGNDVMTTILRKDSTSGCFSFSSTASCNGNGLASVGQGGRGGV